MLRNSFSRNQLEVKVAKGMASLWRDRQSEHKAVEDFKKTEIYKIGNYNTGNLTHYLLASWMAGALEIMQVRYPNNISLDPIKGDSRTKIFTFSVEMIS